MHVLKAVTLRIIILQLELLSASPISCPNKLHWHFLEHHAIQVLSHSLMLHVSGANVSHVHQLFN